VDSTVKACPYPVFSWATNVSGGNALNRGTAAVSDQRSIRDIFVASKKAADQANGKQGAGEWQDPIGSKLDKAILEKRLGRMQY